MYLKKLMIVVALSGGVSLNVHAGMADLMNGVKIGAQAPPVELHYLEVAPTIRKSLVLYDFWATWCEPCRATIPALNALQSRFANKGLVIVGVSPESAETISAFLKTVPMQYASAVDGSPGLHKLLHIRALPYAMFVAPSGKIVWRGQPAEIDDALVNSLLEK